jgi:iron(III) transport system ATP-binding protein
MLSVVELTQRLSPRFALGPLSFSVAPGDVLAVLGPSGSGKTTLLRLVAGLEVPDGGSIGWSGQELSGAKRVTVQPEHRHAGMLFQDGVLFPHLDVQSNVALGLPPGTPRGEGRRRLQLSLEACRIAHLGSARVPELSGGEQQRVALARALAQRPRLMLLDEPFHSLDAPVRRAIMNDCRALLRAAEMAALLVTHDTDEAASFADRILLLRDGRRVQEGTMEQLYTEPVDGWAAAFLGEVESIATADAQAWGIGLPASVAATRLCFRPESLVLSPLDGSSSNTSTPLLVRERRCLGATELVTVALPDGSTLRARSPAGASLTLGQAVGARIATLLPAGAEDAV